MASPSYHRVFPLYLAPFEKFMVADDRPYYPMTFFIVMSFSGHFKKEHFEPALREALNYHQLLQCRVEDAKRGEPCWVHHPELMPRIDWQPEMDLPLESNEGDVIDLREEIGLRIWVRESLISTKITFNFHHACVDGIGAHRFIGDLLAFYSKRLLGEASASPGPIKPELLKTRNHRQQLSGLLRVEDRSRNAILKCGLDLTVRGAAPLHAPLPVQSKHDLRVPKFGIFSKSLSVAEYKQLRDVSIHIGVTVNDILVAQAFLTTCDWNNRHRGWKGFWNRRLRVLLPTDIRARGDDQMPAANMTSYNFLTRGPSDCRDKLALVRNIRNETGQIKHRGLGAGFIDILNGAMVHKWLLPLLLGKRCMSTVVLSNVGDPSRRYTATLPRKNGKLVCGTLELEEITGCTPLRPNTRMTIAVTTYLRKITVGFRFDPYRFDQQHSEQIAEHYMAGLRSWIAEFSPSSDTVSLKEAVEHPTMERIESMGEISVAG